MTWSPKRRPRTTDWRDHLTADERATIADAEVVMSSAKTVVARAAATIAPIRMRAMQRRLYAERATTQEPA